MYSTSVAVRPSAVGGVVAPTSLPLVWAPSLCQIPQHLLASPSGAERRASDSQQAPRLHTSSILMGMEGWCRVALCVRVHWGVCAYGGKPKSGLHEAECVCVCGRSAARVSIHVAAANGMTTSLLPITICLLCANLSQHIQVWPCPHLTLSRSMTRGRTEGRQKGKKENIRALTKTVALGGERWGRSTGVYQREKDETYTQGGHPADSAGSGTNHIPTAPGGLNLHQDFLSHVSSTCQNFSPAFYAQPEI